jgi:sigma-E factor negative regulatory protein RseA
MNEHISALIDNEIELDDANYAINSLHSNQQANEAWANYHLIGDIMRGENPISAGFKHRLMEKIDQEPTVLSPNATSKPTVTSTTNQVINKKIPAVWAIAASLAGVIAVSWALLQTQLPSQTNNMQLASQVGIIKPVQMAQAEVPQALIETNNMAEPSIPNEYLMAHQASAPTTNAYFIQAASYSK